MVATEYAFPLRSESGDIDLYFTEEEGKRTAEIVKSRAVGIKSEVPYNIFQKWYKDTRKKQLKSK